MAIPIAIYHWNVGIVSRGKGKSAVAAAAYRSGEKITNEWDGMTHDYTRKRGVVHTEILLPPHAPPSFSDRSTLWNSVEGTPSLPERLMQRSPQNYPERNRSGLSGNTVPLNLFPEECALIMPSTTPAAATPIVISCLPCAPLTSAEHGRRNPKRNMTLTKTASVSACQVADTRRTRLTSQAGTTKTTPSCGARRGLTIPTTFWRGTEARSVSTTAATPSAALTRYPPSTWAWRLARWRRNKRDKYEEAHRAELALWDAASRYLHANLPKGTKTLPIAEWEQEYADLKTQRDSDYTKLKDTRAEVAELQKIRRCVDIALRADQPEQTQSRTKRHDIDR